MLNEHNLQVGGSYSHYNALQVMVAFTVTAAVQVLCTVRLRDHVAEVVFDRQHAAVLFEESTDEFVFDLVLHLLCI